MMPSDAPPRIRDAGRLESQYAHTHVHAYVDLTRETRKKEISGIARSVREIRSLSLSLSLSLPSFKIILGTIDGHQVADAEMRTQGGRPLVSMKTRTEDRSAELLSLCATASRHRLRVFARALTTRRSRASVSLDAGANCFANFCDGDDNDDDDFARWK